MTLAVPTHPPGLARRVVAGSTSNPLDPAAGMVISAGGGPGPRRPTSTGPERHDEVMVATS